MVTLTELLAHLPPEPDEASLFDAIAQEVAASKRKLVVVDDDQGDSRLGDAGWP